MDLAFFVTVIVVVSLVVSVVVVLVQTDQKLRKTQEEYQSRLEAVQSQVEKISQERPAVEMKKVKILTLGLSASGKTSLTLKWARPIHQEEIQPTAFCDVYNAPCALREIPEERKIIIKWFEIWDFAGESFEEAADRLLRENFEALIFVVDLVGSKDNDDVKQISAVRNSEDLIKTDIRRIKEQMEHFTPALLRIYLKPINVRRRLRSVVLFINKTDKFSSAPQRDVQAFAEMAYRRLIDSFKQMYENVHVVFGSAATGMGTHEVFAHLRNDLLESEDHVKPQSVEAITVDD